MPMAFLLSMKIPMAKVETVTQTEPSVHCFSARVLSRRMVLRRALGTALWAVIPKETSAADYDAYARNYNRLEEGSLALGFGFTQLRREVLGECARGHVLEVAVGTGINLEYYCPQLASKITGVDVSERMLVEASRRAESLGLADRVQLQVGNAEKLEFEDSAFDTVVSTFSLCVIKDPFAAVEEMARVCRGGGRILLLEHTRSDLGPLGWYQDVTAAPVASMSKGCRWNVDVAEIVRQTPSLQLVSDRRRNWGTVSFILAEKCDR